MSLIRIAFFTIATWIFTRNISKIIINNAKHIYCHSIYRIIFFLFISIIINLNKYFLYFSKIEWSDVQLINILLYLSFKKRSNHGKQLINTHTHVYIAHCREWETVEFLILFFFSLFITVVIVIIIKKKTQWRHCS